MRVFRNDYTIRMHVKDKTFEYYNCKPRIRLEIKIETGLKFDQLE